MASLLRAPAPFARQVRAVFARELRSQRKAFLGWTLPALALLAVALAMQPQVAKDASLLALKMEAMPASITQALGLSLDNLADPVVWLATGFLYPALLGGLLAGLLGASAVAREEAERTAELLLVQPLQRSTLMLGKVLAGLTLLVAYCLLLSLGGLLVYTLVDVKVASLERYFLVFGALWLAQCTLFSLTLLLSVSSRRVRGVLPLGLGVTFALFGVGVTGAAVESLHALTYLSPFKATDAAVVARTGALPDAGYALPLLAALALGLAFWRYRRRDIAT